jgi:diadenylate cyclase
MDDVIQVTLQHTNWLVLCKNFLQVVIIVYGLIWAWRRIIGTQAERLVKGVLVLVIVAIASYFAGFTLITSALQHIIPVAVMAAVIIFQPELRRGLGYLGRMQTFRIDFSLPDTAKVERSHDINQIITAVKELSRNKVGALLVIEPLEGERDYLSPGTPINADISSNLLLTIFFPKSPLHDGAVVIRDKKIVAAGVILPMTDNSKLSQKYGTRHRAAIGLSEIYDGLCIVVSEETGAVSAASRGMLARYTDPDELMEPISYLYEGQIQASSPSLLSSLVNLWPWLKKSTTSGATHSVQIEPVQTSEPETIIDVSTPSSSAIEGLS